MTCVFDSLAAPAGVNSDAYTPVLAVTLNDETWVVCKFISQIWSDFVSVLHYWVLQNFYTTETFAMKSVKP